MIDLAQYIQDVIDGLSDIPQEYYDVRLAYKDLQRAYKFIYMIVDPMKKAKMDADDISEIECCLISLAVYYAYRNYTVAASQRLGSMPESSPVQLSYLMEDARNCLAWISSVPLDSNLMPVQQTWAAYGSVRGTSVI